VSVRADEEEIRGLVAAYAERLDAGDLDGVAQLFAHGVFRSPQTGKVLTGVDEVRSLYESVIIYDDGTPRTRHVLGNILVEVASPDATTAGARCTFTVFQAEPGRRLRAVLAGRYHDRFERVAGEWRFAERTVLPDLAGDLSGHMGRGRD
jgi:3-phenylpropionate/cinnamic acid dioxygenase small subunit